MDDSQRSELQAFAAEADGLADDVEAALDEHATLAFQRETRRKKIDDLSRRFHALLATLADEKDRFAAERNYGERIVNVQKMAVRLPTAPQGKPAERPADTGFMETRAPKSSRPPMNPGLAPGERLRDRNLVHVTGEIDAWCGRCAMVRTQVVAAVVGDQPAQVVCTICGSRSRYREGPARGGKKEEPAVKRASTSSAPPPLDPKQKEKNDLLAALRSAENVRAYSPKERYKVGEIIDHPEHGRGRIENTLPRSLLVRFAGGLKPLKLG